MSVDLFRSFLDSQMAQLAFASRQSATTLPAWLPANLDKSGRGWLRVELYQPVQWQRRVLRTFGELGKEADQLNCPHGLIMDTRVTLLDRDKKVIEHPGDDLATEWRKTRVMARDRFTPGRFVAPHGACFDHAGNIFVVEWVEVGQVTKLRKV